MVVYTNCGFQLSLEVSKHALAHQAPASKAILKFSVVLFGFLIMLSYIYKWHCHTSVLYVCTYLLILVTFLKIYIIFFQKFLIIIMLKIFYKNKIDKSINENNSNSTCENEVK